MLEVVKHYPQYTWGAALDELSMVIARLYMEIPDIHLKRAWPFMQLQAFVGNALGGKGKGGEKPDPKSVFSPPEFAPWYARGADAIPEPPLQPQHCWALVEAIEAGHLKGASWCVQMVEIEDDLERVRAVAEGYGALLEGDAAQGSL
ncbi:hypothetical protein Dcar01_02393 [Deinococcus carri]|uniref:Uncharacterized protein n=1 Tax=Deinococcus carri TaxID=1211323 RepID=A0ABP9W8K7_9DEIO